MQTPKSRVGSLETRQKKSPAAATPRTARRLKTGGTQPVSVSVSSPNTKSQSPKVAADRRSPRAPVSEVKEKRTGRIQELEGEICRLQEELSVMEGLKKEAEKEVEESKGQLMEMAVSEDSRIDELRKLSQERDKSWQSELEAMQLQHEMDTAALGSAMNEIQKLKSHLSESDQTLFVDNLRMELSETLSLVDKLRAELFDAKEAEEQLKLASSAMETELEESRSKVRSLERKEEIERLRIELDLARNEINELKSAVEAAEGRYHEEYIQSTLQIRSAYEQVEEVRSEHLKREIRLQEDLKNIKSESEAKLRMISEENEKLEGDVMDKEMELQSIMSQNESVRTCMEKMEGEKKEALSKLGNMAEEADKRAEQLGAAEAVKAEMETEMRKLKVQCDQWRKAAEAAAAIINNGKYVERTSSLESPMRRRSINMSPCVDETDEELSPKKKNGNMLKKISGVLLMKSQK